MSRGSNRRWRWALAAAAVVLAAATLIDHMSWRVERRRLRQLLTDSGIAARRPEVLADLDRSPGRVRSRLRAVRAILADQLDLRLRPDLTPEELDAAAEAGLEHLATIRRLTTAALDEQPGSWQAAMVLGGATYLEWARGGRRQASEEAAWRAPLEHALALAPGQTEPVRLLVAAELGEWSRLPPDRRAALEPLVARALADPRSFDLLFAYWLRVAPTQARAFAAIPEAPWAWDRVASYYAEASDWERYSQAREHRLAALDGYLAMLLDDARRRAEGGDWHHARSRLASILTLAPVTASFAPTLAAVLELEPPQGYGRQFSGTFRDWLEWTLDRCRVGPCGLDVGRLARLARGRDRLAPAVEAQVELLAGNSATSERLAIAADDDPRWIDYYRLDGRLRRDAGDLVGALRALNRLETATGRGVVYWVEASALAATAGEPEAKRRADEALEALAERGLATAQWRSVGRNWRLDLWLSESYDSLRLGWAAAPQDGGAVALRWNGAHAGFHPVAPGRSSRIDLAAAPGPHRLEALRANGGAPAPGRLRTSGRASANAAPPLPQSAP